MTIIVRFGTALALLAPALVAAQQPTRRQPTIEIRGQVPTPQVVTVRPREVPTYSRQVLVPEFYDRDFWQSILPGYQVVPRRTLDGTRPTIDTTRAVANRAPINVPIGAPAIRDRTPGAAAAIAEIDPSLPPAERARQAEVLALKRELDRRRARFDSLAARVDTLFRPGGVRRSALDTVPDTTTTRRPPR
jgi:hypothetical protein